MVTVRYLTEKRDFKPPAKTDRNFSLDKVRPADIFFHSYFCIEDSEVTDTALLPNKIQVHLLNVEVFMVIPVRIRGGQLSTECKSAAFQQLRCGPSALVNASLMGRTMRFLLCCSS